MLESNDLTEMRATAAEALPEACEVWRVAQAESSNGGLTPTRTKLETTHCRVGKTNRPGELLIAERRSVATPYTVTLPWNSAARERDEIVSGGRTLRVIGAIRGSWDTALRCVCEEVK